MLFEGLQQSTATPSFSAATRSAFDVLVFSMSFGAGCFAYSLCEQKEYEAVGDSGQRAGHNVRTPGVGLKEKFSSGIFSAAPDHHGYAHKRVKTFFARGNRVRRRSGLRSWLLLPEQSNGNHHQSSKHAVATLKAF